MGWRGIENLPPGFDVFAGKAGQLSIVDQVIKGDIVGVTASQQELFRDLKRHLLHRDYARYFENTLVCADLLKDLRGGEYSAQAIADIVQPALRVAIEQMESIRADVARSVAARRKLEYDAQSSLDQLHRKARPIALAWAAVEGAAQLEPTYADISRAIQDSTR
jgi:hypothetical protein